jgi:hypothetical protein
MKYKDFVLMFYPDSICCLNKTMYVVYVYTRDSNTPFKIRGNWDTVQRFIRFKIIRKVRQKFQSYIETPDGILLLDRDYNREMITWESIAKEEQYRYLWDDIFVSDAVKPGVLDFLLDASPQS